MKPQRFFIVADDGETQSLLSWTLTLEDARKYAERAALEMPTHTILLSQMLFGVQVETRLKWTDQCAAALSA